jgi:type VI protein secretion system component VasF
VSAVGFDTKENGGSDHRRGLRQRSRSVLLAVTGWDVLAFCVVLVVIIGFEYSKVMFREDYSLSRMLVELLVIGAVVGAVVLLSSIVI